MNDYNTSLTPAGRFTERIKRNDNKSNRGRWPYRRRSQQPRLKDTIILNIAM